ncbi:MAG: sodium:calcium antiporter [Candidatus Limnocylindrales bacterium]
MELPVFIVATVVSLGASVMVVSRLERLCETAGVAEALLGLLVALAADGPEITAALTAAATGQHTVGVGVVLGSNILNLAALLGLSAVVSGRLILPRLTVTLEGGLAIVIGLIAVTTVTAWIGPWAGLVVALCAFLPYVAFCALRPADRARLPLPRPLLARLRRAIEQEEVVARPVPLGDRWDLVLAVAAAVVVIGASVVMEQAATALGTQAGVSEIVIGALVLAAVTSLPNAVGAIYLATRGRGVATMSEAFHSNTFNILIGLLLPAAILGLGPMTHEVPVLAGAYLALTVASVILAWAGRGLGRVSGSLIIAGYLAYVCYLLATAA